MRIVEPSAKIVSPVDGPAMLRRIEWAGRTCYKSEASTEDGGTETFVRNLIRRGHESVLEHESVTVKFVVDRGVSHEIVRHRIAAYSQESTRYCNYSHGKFGGEITVVKPCFWEEESTQYKEWEYLCRRAEATYLFLLRNATPEEARTVLPTSLKTELVMTTNLREWRHFFQLRTAKAAHPQMREVAIPLLREMNRSIPAVFEDLERMFDHAET